MVTPSTGKGYRNLRKKLRVSGNYRVIFRFEDGNVYDVDYLDYH
ncbi:type II toxin-antitoxin system RelE/ParE family toxin [Dyadobacter beijingensis]